MRFLWKQWRERNMRTGKSEWKGTRKVLAFTFSSLFKGKANLATLIVFLICGLLAPPLFFLFGGSGTSAPAEHELSRSLRMSCLKRGRLNMRRIPPGHLVRKRLQ